MRKLQVTTAGFWYLAMTIGIGVVALLSGNNIIYLIESLLLSGLILSGVVSERAVSGVSVEFLPQPAISGEASADRIRITNHRRATLFCMEILLWEGKRYECIAKVPRLEPRASTVVTAQNLWGPRGQRKWTGYAVATGYPFGFARKLRLQEAPGDRLIWPERAKESRARAFETQPDRARGEQQWLEGEVRAWSEDDDVRNVIWTVSSRSQDSGDWVSRPRSLDLPTVESVLDLAALDFERAVIRAAEPLYSVSQSNANVVLTVKHPSGREQTRRIIRITGRERALDYLATVSPHEGSRPS